MSSFPPPPSPPPPPPSQQPNQQAAWSTPISSLTDPPPPVGAKKSGIPTVVWIVAVVALLGGGAVALFALGGDDDKKAGSGTTVVLGADDTIDTAGTGSEDSTPQDTTPASTPTGISGTREDPVPVGQVADIGGDWRLQVLDVIPDASEQMAAADEFYDAPPAGSTYMLVRIALGYFGSEDPKIAFEPDVDVFGSSGVTLDDFCLATVPDEIDFFNYVFSGGVVVGNACFVAPIAEAGTFQLFGKGDFFDDEGVYLELGAPNAAVEPMASLTGPQPGAASTAARLSPTPVGTPTDVGSDWQVTVTGAVRDITAEVLAENQFNEKPPPGYHFVGIEMTFAYSGAGGASPAQVSIGAVSDDNVQHDGYCGIVPGEIDLYTELFAGGSASGTLCVLVPENAGSIALFATADFNGYLWFATS
ncbi:MAG: hypothetical protein ABL953_13360 [Ilumatobacteraceae bacterium]